MAIDFLIVGGGIGGAVLANLLTRRGKRVLILEKDRTRPPQNRPEILWPATVKILRDLIPQALEERWMLPIRGGMVTCGGEVLVRIELEVISAAQTRPISTANTRELLLVQAGCECRRGVEVREILRDRGRVVGVRAADSASGAEQELLAEWTVGDDGAHSAVRRGCGLSMNLVRFPIDLLGFSFNWPARLPPDMARIWVNPQRARTGILGMPAAPLPEGRGAALIPVWPEVLQDEGRFQQGLRSFAAGDFLLEEMLGGRSYPAGFTRFRIGFCRAPRFGIPGAMLIGDAAHPVTPAGGQGANLSVADALVIAEAALQRPDTVLEEYRRRRYAATMRSLSFSRGAFRVFSLPRVVLDVGLMVLPWLARRLGARPKRFARLLRTASEAFREERLADGSAK
jgi:2-polyprenyl-6-methoxyphenol hydroxylase-like FAD-dependent oxidoreductase